MAKGVSRPADLARRHQFSLGLVALAMLPGLLLVAITSYRAALFNSEADAKTALTLQVNGFVNSLGKYRLLTPLIARRPDILSVFSGSGDDEDMETAEGVMTRIAGMSGAADIELNFPDGTSLSLLAGSSPMSNDQRARLLERQDLIEARQGRLGRQLIVEDAGRFYVFSSAARIDDNVVGIVSVWVDLTQIELSAHPIIATERGQIVLTNQESWYDARLYDEGDEKTIRGSTDRDLTRSASLFGPIVIAASSEDGLASIERDYVAARVADPILGWTFYALEPLRGPIIIAAMACLTAALFSGLLLGGLWVVFNRQQQQLSHRRKEMATSLWLERRVRDRTRELRQTQEGLIHSAKLAAIGQMSAVLSHEYNQPLAAIRSYADNAQLLFEKGRLQQGQDNLSRIGRLVDKLANLSKSLKTFARKPGVDTKAISVAAVVDESVMLMLPQARKEGVELAVVREGDDFDVLAGHTRLEQVLINLIANALDAIVSMPLEGEGPLRPKEPLVKIHLHRSQSEGIVEVRDNGPGIPESLQGDIFEPFITSKEHGVGLGLGLPIAYNLVKGFGGTLSILPDAGDSMSTCFEIRLPLAT